jgi:hypothetical protein
MASSYLDKMRSSHVPHTEMQGCFACVYVEDFGCPLLRHSKGYASDKDDLSCTWVSSAEIHVLLAQEHQFGLGERFLGVVGELDEVGEVQKNAMAGHTAFLDSNFYQVDVKVCLEEGHEVS